MFPIKYISNHPNGKWPLKPLITGPTSQGSMMSTFLLRNADILWWMLFSYRKRLTISKYMWLTYWQVILLRLLQQSSSRSKVNRLTSQRLPTNPFALSVVIWIWPRVSWIDGHSHKTFWRDWIQLRSWLSKVRSHNFENYALIRPSVLMG